MQISQYNINQQNPNFGMIKLPLEKNAKPVRYAYNHAFRKKIEALREQGLLEIGRDKSFNPIMYVKTKFNSPQEKEILASLQKSSRIGIRTVDFITGHRDIQRQSIFKVLCDLKKTKREEFPAKFDKVFPDAFVDSKKAG